MHMAETPGTARSRRAALCVVDGDDRERQSLVELLGALDEEE